METALRARLLAAAPVTALVGNRVDWENRPQGAPLPDVMLSIITDDRPQHLKGFQSLRPTRVQADVRALTFATKRQLREAVIAALVPEGTFGGIRFDRAEVEVRSMNERTETQFIFRDAIDFIIWWRVAA